MRVVFNTLILRTEERSIVGLPAQELYFSENEQPNVIHSDDSRLVFVQTSPQPLLEDKIKIIGIGNGGRNALNHIIATGSGGVGCLVVDTDIRSLEKSSCKNKIILGKSGTGAGCIPQNGEDAARMSLGEIMDFIRGADMVYLTAGMGGGTGTGAIPVIAEAARNLGVLTVAVVTKPFAFEGARKMRIALEGIEKLRNVVDAIIVIPNEKLLENSDSDTTIPEAFAKADDVLRQAVVGVTELITHPGMVNMDFADVKAVMKKSGIAVMGTGYACGENRIEEALRQAMESPLMETAPANASGVLMNITSAGTLTIYELQQAAARLREYIADDTLFVWGTAENPEVEEYVKITVIATGIYNKAPDSTLKTGKKDGAFVKNTDSTAAAVPQLEGNKAAKSEAFIPGWLRNNDKQETAKQKIEFQPAASEEQEEAVYDDPTWIRRKTETPKLS